MHLCTLARAHMHICAGEALLGRRIMRRWSGYGWCHGRITRTNTDAEVQVGDGVANFFVKYDIDRQDSAHVLEVQEYLSTKLEDADYDTWLLLEELLFEEVQGTEETYREA